MTPHCTSILTYITYFWISTKTSRGRPVGRTSLPLTPRIGVTFQISYWQPTTSLRRANVVSQSSESKDRSRLRRRWTFCMSPMTPTLNLTLRSRFIITMSAVSRIMQTSWKPTSTKKSSTWHTSTLASRARSTSSTTLNSIRPQPRKKARTSM